MDTAEVTLGSIRFAAMNLLSMREHSVKELAQKLTKKFYHTEFDYSEKINQAINELTSDGLQSDLRFSEAFLGMRKRQGKGPMIIIMELRERGVSGNIIESIVCASDKSWSELAAAARNKKFGALGKIDMKERAKQMRFLSGRGFGSADIKFALSFTDEGYEW